MGIWGAVGFGLTNWAGNILAADAFDSTDARRAGVGWNHHSIDVTRYCRVEYSSIAEAYVIEQHGRQLWICRFKDWQ